MKTPCIFVLIFLTISLGLAQNNETPMDSLTVDQQALTLVNEFYVYGDAQTIGNTILSVHHSKAFNKTNAINDDLKMKYVDIDDDKSTFSSSSAVLNLPQEFKKIVYAGLYWTGTYSYEIGKRKKNKGKYIYSGELRADDSIEKIKYKTQNSSYRDLIGVSIYDGMSSTNESNNAGYLCYADLTDALASKPLQGNFTVANIKASRGYISGGSSAGWLLYMVYETSTDNPKYMSSFSGFTGVETDPVSLHFKTIQNIAKTTMVLGALEGDSSLKQDFVMMSTDSSQQALTNSLRSADNFFNSKITKNNRLSNERWPNSWNTLGFDIAELDLPHLSKTGETPEGLGFNFRPGSDAYSLFFVAFQSEISKSYYDKIIQEKARIADSLLGKLPKIDPKKTRPKTKKKSSWSKPKRLDLNSKAFSLLKSKKSTIITDIKSGYYLITNVFSDPVQAIKWEDILIKRGFQARSFKNPKNNWNYVYILQTENAEEAFLKQQEIVVQKRFKDAWILKVNLD